MQKINLKIVGKTISSFFKEKKFLIFSGRPLSDWKMLVCFFTVLNVIVITVCFYFYQGIDHGDFFTAKEDNQIKISSIKREALDVALKYFTDRDNLFNKIKQTSIPLDPSI